LGYTLKLDANAFKVVGDPTPNPVSFGIAQVYWATSAVYVDNPPRPRWWYAKRSDDVDPIAQMRMKDEDSRFEPELLQRPDRIAVIFRLSEQPYFPWNGDNLPKFIEHLPVVGQFAEAAVQAITNLANPNIDLRMMVQFVNEHDGTPRILLGGTHNAF